MKTILLPGFSERNKEWAEEVQAALLPEIELTIHAWPHWEAGAVEEGWLEREADKVLLYDEPVQVIAKSIGTLVLMKALNKKPSAVSKMILTGIPLQSFAAEDSKQFGVKDGDIHLYEILRDIPSSNVLCMQNVKDTTGSFEEVQAFIGAIHPGIQVVSKDRDDHHYPFPEDFKNFFTS